MDFVPSLALTVILQRHQADFRRHCTHALCHLQHSVSAPWALLRNNAACHTPCILLAQKLGGEVCAASSERGMSLRMTSIKFIMTPLSRAIFFIVALVAVTSFNTASPKTSSFVGSRNIAVAMTAAPETMASSQLPAIAEETKKVVKKPKVKETDLGIKYVELKKGEGPYPQEGDYVVINYSAFFLNGTIFDTTERKGGKPLSFRFGRKQIIPGIESVLESMQPGGERTCTIPAEYAYGKKGVCVKDQCLVPPDTPVRYVLKLKSLGAGFN